MKRKTKRRAKKRLRVKSEVDVYNERLAKDVARQRWPRGQEPSPVTRVRPLPQPKEEPVPTKKAAKAKAKRSKKQAPKPVYCRVRDIKDAMKLLEDAFTAAGQRPPAMHAYIKYPAEKFLIDAAAKIEQWPPRVMRSFLEATSTLAEIPSDQTAMVVAIKRVLSDLFDASEESSKIDSRWRMWLPQRRVTGPPTEEESDASLEQLKQAGDGQRSRRRKRRSKKRDVEVNQESTMASKKKAASKKTSKKKVAKKTSKKKLNAKRVTKKTSKKVAKKRTSGGRRFIPKGAKVFRVKNAGLPEGPRTERQREAVKAVKANGSDVRALMKEHGRFIVYAVIDKGFLELRSK